MEKAYIFRADFCICAETEEQARDGLMELLAELVRKDNSEAFELIENLEEGNEQ